MLDQLIDNFRKSSDSALKMQQEWFKQCFQQLTTVRPVMSAANPEWSQAFQKRGLELLVD